VRLINTTAGCISELLFLLLIGHHSWIFSFVLVISVLISNYLIRMPTSWRIAPITTAIIIADGMSQEVKFRSLEIALHRTGGGFFGQRHGAINHLDNVICLGTA